MHMHFRLPHSFYALEFAFPIPIAAGQFDYTPCRCLGQHTSVAYWKVGTACNVTHGMTSAGLNDAQVTGVSVLRGKSETKFQGQDRPGEGCLLISISGVGALLR